MNIKLGPLGKKQGQAAVPKVVDGMKASESFQEFVKAQPQDASVKCTEVCSYLNWSFQQLGQAFAWWCEELAECCEPPCYSNYTTGPVHKDINNRSIIAIASNDNDFPVQVLFKVISLSGGLLIPWYCEDVLIPACSALSFQTVDMSAYTFDQYSITFRVVDGTGNPVCSNVFFYASGRSDEASVDQKNSHLIAAETFNHNRFNPFIPADRCECICPVLMGITLTWGETPSDLDSHLVTPVIYGQPYEVFFGNMGSLNTPPFARLDQDVVTGFGPETISISQFKAGTYQYFVHNFSNETPITESGAKVTIYNAAGAPIRTYDVPTTGTGDIWNVFNLVVASDGALPVIVDVNTIEPWSTLKALPSKK